jgi:manganese transport system permease protein
MGDAVSHAVLPGVVVASIVGLPFAVGALIAGFVAVGAIGVIRDRSRVKEDAAMGIVFTTMFATGLVLISVIPSQTDLQHIIFGDVLGVSNADLVQIGALSAAVIVTVIVKRRDLTLYAFDAQHAFAIGLSPQRLRALLLAVLAATAVVALQVAGVILVVAMLVIPGATARLLTDRFGRMLVIAPIIAAAAAVAGIYLSFWWDTASGPLVVVVQGVVFAAVWLVSPRRRTGSTGRPRRRAAIVGA